MFYEYEHEQELYTDPALQNLETGLHAEESTPQIVIINGTNPSLQNKIARELQLLLANKYTHISIYPYLVDNSDTAVEELHSRIMSLAAQGENIIVSYNPFFEDTLSSLQERLRVFSPYLVNIFSRAQKPLFTAQARLSLCLEDIDENRAAYAIYQSMLSAH